MSVIRVNPESVVAYGRDAQDRFDRIRVELKGLVVSVAEVRYFGPNAVAFKTGSSQMAADFANQFNKSLSGIADSIRLSTSNIAAALGGQPINIAVSGTPIDVPTIISSEVVDIDLTALEGLAQTVNRNFDRISELVGGHLVKLEGTDWVGQSREATVEAVRKFTSNAKSSCAEAQQGLTRRINDQVTAARQADNR